MESIPSSERSKNVTNIDLDYDDFPSEKALGVLWEVESDRFSFCVRVLEKPATKWGIMSTVCCLYYPLGMVAPCVLLGMMILQESCRLKSGWDVEVSTDLQGRWRLWLQDLPVLDNFTMDRCVSPAGFGEVKSATLHHFGDACQSGYGCISYLRLLNYSDEVHCTFFFAEASVAPLKQLTIPRMELTAATVAIRVDTQLRAELTIPLDDSQYWTDNIFVLGYIKMIRQDSRPLLPTGWQLFMNVLRALSGIMVPHSWTLLTSHPEAWLPPHWFRTMGGKMVQSFSGNRSSAGLASLVLIRSQKRILMSRPLWYVWHPWRKKQMILWLESWLGFPTGFTCGGLSLCFTGQPRVSNMSCWEPRHFHIQGHQLVCVWFIGSWQDHRALGAE